jgi:general secretion pathway protein C
MLKDFKFIILVLFMGLTAFLIARLFNQVILNKAMVYKEVVILGNSKGNISKSNNNQKTARYIVSKNIFNSELSFGDKKISDVYSNEDVKKEEENSNGYICEISSIVADIKATMPAIPKEYSYFAMIDNGTKKIKYYGEGDDFVDAGVTVYDIRRSVIMLDRNGKKECLFLGMNGKQRNESPRNNNQSAAMNNNINRSGSRIDVKQTGENAYTIDAEDLNKELKSLSQLSREARGVFARDKDNPSKSLGFKLFAIKRGSLFEKIGIKNGDIIQAINGEALDNPDKALEMYSKLQDGISGLNVSVLRHGKKVTMDYSVK